MSDAPVVCAYCGTEVNDVEHISRREGRVGYDARIVEKYVVDCESCGQYYEVHL